MRQPSPIFDAAEQQGLSIGQPNGSCVEDTVDGIGPIVPAEDRVKAMADKQWNVGVGHGFQLFECNSLWQRIWRSNWIQSEVLIS